MTGRAGLSGLVLVALLACLSAIADFSRAGALCQALTRRHSSLRQTRTAPSCDAALAGAFSVDKERDVAALRYATTVVRELHTDLVCPWWHAIAALDIRLLQASHSLKRG